MMVSIATNRYVELDELIEFVRPRHRAVLLTTRADGRPQGSLVTLGVTDDNDLVVATYPQRSKVANAERNPLVSVIVQSDDFGGEWVQVDGTATVTHVPEAVDGLVEYFRVISGEHPDWEEYRHAMIKQNKSLIKITIERWGPIAKGGFPAAVAAEM